MNETSATLIVGDKSVEPPTPTSATLAIGQKSVELPIKVAARRLHVGKDAITAAFRTLEARRFLIRHVTGKFAPGARTAAKWELTWRWRFVVDTYARSPMVRQHLTRFKEWYQPALIKMVENVQPRTRGI